MNNWQRHGEAAAPSRQSGGHAVDVSHQPDEAGARDPVCGMTVKRDTPYQTEHAGTLYYFCGAACQQKFDAAPSHYTKPPDASGTDAAEAVPGTIYTCPMHPEIRQDHPGACPKCGMALEPEMPSLEAEDNPELAAFRHRFWWTLPLTVAVVLLVMLGSRFRGAGSGNTKLGGACLVRTGRAMGRLSDLRQMPGLVPQPQPEHVDVDRSGDWCGVRVQRRGHGCARAISPHLCHAWPNCGLFRSRGRHHFADIAWPDF
ncbi:heavy metal-binding domain-containing protein [Cupriavidus ulmosensis]